MSLHKRWYIVAILVGTGSVVATNVVLVLTHTMKHWPIWGIGLAGGIMGLIAFIPAIWVANQLCKPAKHGRPAKSPLENLERRVKVLGATVATLRKMLINTLGRVTKLEGTALHSDPPISADADTDGEPLEKL